MFLEIGLEIVFLETPSEVFLEIGFLKMSIKFTGEQPCPSAISIELQKQLL